MTTSRAPILPLSSHLATPTLVAAPWSQLASFTTAPLFALLLATPAHVQGRCILKNTHFVVVAVELQLSDQEHAV